MPTDFAAKVRKPNKNTRKTKRKNKVSRRKSKEFGLHGPSFSAGTLLGAAIVIGMAYLPGYFKENSSTLADIENSVNAPEPKIQITFPRLLKESQVKADTSKYQINSGEQNLQKASQDFLYQTASFRNSLDAEKMRADLLLNNLQASIKIKTLNKVEWHRVVVGPFDNRSRAEQTRLKLIELNIPAIKVSNTD